MNNKQASNQMSRITTTKVLYKTAVVEEGLSIFYREAGEPGNPKLLLLHGFPASSHQYRNLISTLSDRFHIIAPDYPGFGNSNIPSPDKLEYTFDRLSEIIEDFLQKIGFTHFGLYMQDYGGPVGFRIVTRHPDWLEWLIIQNSNAYEIGFTGAWDGLKSLWKNRTPETEKPLYGLMQLDAIKQIYLYGHKNPELINPDNWNLDYRSIERPNAQQVQMDLFYDYRTNLSLYPKWQGFLHEHQPKTLIFWGQNDIFFTKEGGEAYLKDIPDAELHRFDSGHFVLEDCLQEIVTNMQKFYVEKIAQA